MDTFEAFKLSKPIRKALDELGFEHPTPIQSEAFNVVRSGKNVIGVAQTGTGKTLAYLLPLLSDLKYSEQVNPRILILVPTRDLVNQVVAQLESITQFMTVRILGIAGGTNIRTQRVKVAPGGDVIVATPRRLYDLVLDKVIKLNDVKKVVIDEVDVLLDLGFRPQLVHLFDHLPTKRQHILFSATMTEEVDGLLQDFLFDPVRISIAVSGTPLAGIEQWAYPVKNYYTKQNLLIYLLEDRETYPKVLVFTPSKKVANRLYEALSEAFGPEVGVIHGDKSQNTRTGTIAEFDAGTLRILVATDVVARGLDFAGISHVISFDTPVYPENYIHRMGRTGRAEAKGTAILFFTEQEAERKAEIETLMGIQIPEMEFPPQVDLENELAPEERIQPIEPNSLVLKKPESDPGFHEKKAKNKKVNMGGGQHKKRLKAKHKNPLTRGDKGFNQRKKNKKKKRR